MSNYKYLVLTDLEGTLLNSNGKPSQKTIDYVHELNKRDDILFTFNTGSSWNACKEIYDELQLKGIACCSNGSYLYNPHTQQQFKCFLSVYMLEKILVSPLMINQLVSGVIITEDQEIEFNYTDSLDALKKIQDQKQNPYYMTLTFDDSCTNLNEKMSFVKSFEPIPKMTILKRNNLVDLHLQASYVNKEFSVEYLSNFYGVVPENILTFGDSNNDIEVLSGNSRSYAVANALPQVKQYAKMVSKYTNDQDSVIKEIKMFLDVVDGKEEVNMDLQQLKVNLGSTNK